MVATVFIDGDVGTTGLQVRARLEDRKDIQLLCLPEDQRKDPQRRAEMLNSADLSILCLPDAAAREAAAMIESETARLVDASTAHRVDPAWTYGFAEMEKGQESRIASARRVSNPGCYPTGAIALIRPLVTAGLVPADFPLVIPAVSGYSGGGKGLIQSFESPEEGEAGPGNFFHYGLSLNHKHLPEIRHFGLLGRDPIFCPSVGRYAQGMIVQVPLDLAALSGQVTGQKIHEALSEHFRGQVFVTVQPLARSAAIDRLDPEALNGTNSLELHVFVNEDRRQALLCARLDNLGKGASGAAVQNMNLMLGLDPAAGLTAAAVAA